MSPLPKWYILVDFAYIATGSAVSIKLDVGVNGRSPLPLNKQFWQNTDLDPPNPLQPRTAFWLGKARSVYYLAEWIAGVGGT